MSSDSSCNNTSSSPSSDEIDRPRTIEASRHETCQQTTTSTTTPSTPSTPTTQTARLKINRPPHKTKETINKQDDPSKDQESESSDDINFSPPIQEHKEASKNLQVLDFKVKTNHPNTSNMSSARKHHSIASSKLFSIQQGFKSFKHQNNNDTNKNNNNKNNNNNKKNKNESFLNEELKYNLYSQLNNSLVKSNQQIQISEYTTFNKIKKNALLYIQEMKDKLSFLGNVLRLKFLAYSTWYDRSQVTIICLSVAIAFSTATQAEVINLVSTNATQTFLPGISSRDLIQAGFSFFVLACSTAIALISSVIKFKQWKEKASNMKSCQAQSTYTIETLEIAKERLKLSTNQTNIDDVINNDFLNTTFTLYLKNLSRIKELLPLDSQAIHLPKFFALSLESEKAKIQYKNELKKLIQNDEDNQNNHQFDIHHSSTNKRTPDETSSSFGSLV